MNFDSTQRRLILAGAVLFLTGLLQGGLVAQFLNPRMALSAHLTAVQSGLAVMACGVVWPAAMLSPRFAAFARWAIAGGMWLLWFALTLAAATGASAALPMAGAGHAAGASEERLVATLVAVSAVAMTLGWAVLVWGLARGLRRPSP